MNDELLIQRIDAHIAGKTTRALLDLDRAVRGLRKLLRERDAEIARLRAASDAAAAYRAAELDGTPRMWRGKDLQDLATTLDEKIEALAPAKRPETPR